MWRFKPLCLRPWKTISTRADILFRMCALLRQARLRCDPPFEDWEFRRLSLILCHSLTSHSTWRPCHCHTTVEFGRSHSGMSTATTGGGLEGYHVVFSTLSCLFQRRAICQSQHVGDLAGVIDYEILRSSLSLPDW